MTGFFSLVLAFNSGAAFSFLRDVEGWPRYLFSAVAIAAGGLIVWLLRRGGDRWYCAGLALILGGAVGNLWDRLTLGTSSTSSCSIGIAGTILRSTSPTARSRSVPPCSSSTASGGGATTRHRELKVPSLPPWTFCLRQSPRLLRRRRPRDLHRRAGAAAIRRADLCAPRGRAQQVRRRRTERLGAVFVDELAQVPPGSIVIFQRATAFHARCVPKPTRAVSGCSDATSPW